MYDMEPKYKVGDKVGHVTGSVLIDPMIVIGVVFQQHDFCYYCRWSVHGTMHTSFFEEMELEPYHNPKSWDGLKKELEELQRKNANLEAELSCIPEVKAFDLDAETYALKNAKGFGYGNYWLHKKTNTMYYIAGFELVRLERDGEQSPRYVSYVKAKLDHDGNPGQDFNETVWVRPVTEFLDGRFEFYEASEATTWLKENTEYKLAAYNVDNLNEDDDEDPF